jgi:ferredoxin
MALISFWERMRIPSYDNSEHCMMARVSIDHDKCNCCGLCVKACLPNALYMEGKGKDRKVMVNPNRPTGGREAGDANCYCVACNDCMAICEQGAIKAVTSADYRYRYKQVMRGELALPRTFSS